MIHFYLYRSVRFLLPCLVIVSTLRALGDPVGINDGNPFRGCIVLTTVPAVGLGVSTRLFEYSADGSSYKVMLSSNLLYGALGIAESGFTSREYGIVESFERTDSSLILSVTRFDNPQLHRSDFTQSDSSIFNFESEDVGYINVRTYSEARFRLISKLEGYRGYSFSTRGYVSLDKRLIMGFVVPDEGTQIREVYVRAIGPSLSQFGVANCASGTSVEIYDSSGLLFARASERPWDADSESKDQVRDANLRMGAFPLIEGSNESVVDAILPAGTYTAVISISRGASDGEALCEVYISK